MFGMEFLEFAGFGRQVGLALAGATSLWGFVFLLVARKKESEQEKIILRWVGERLLFLFFAGMTLALGFWLVIISSLPVFGHEGVTLYPTLVESIQAYQITFPIYIFWLLFSLSGLFLYVSRRDLFRSYLPWFFAINFLVVSFLISLYAWTGEVFSSNQIFFYFHGFHSIMTVGTVLTLDFLFLSSRRSLKLQSVIFPFFPQISKVIWVGLALDFLSVTLVFDQALELAPRFFFAQTVVSILIINGAFLSGPLTRRLMNGLRKGVLPLAGRWGRIATICGSISIVSWLSITFIDFFPNIELAYWQMITFYITAIVFAFIVNLVVEKFSLAVAKEPAGI